MMTIFPWQKSQWQYLLSRKNKGSLPHALLLNGQEGMGKRNFAYALAEFILCQNATDTACGKCQSCHWLQHQNHPDFLNIQPEVDSFVIKIDQVRHLIEWATKTAQHSEYQVTIIYPAEAMNMAAANALLKMLEEPTGNIVFILVSHDLARLAPTIRSRCQTLFFGDSDKLAIENWLQAQLPVSENAQGLLKLTEGSPLKALALAQEGKIKEYHEIITNLIALNNKNLSPIKCASLYVNQDIENVLQIISVLLLDAIRVKLIKNTYFITNQSSKELIETFANKNPLDYLFNLYDRVVNHKRDCQKNINLNKNLLLENIFIHF